MEILVNRILVNVMTASAMSDKFCTYVSNTEIWNCRFLSIASSSTQIFQTPAGLIEIARKGTNCLRVGWWYFSNCNVHTNHWRSCQNADFSSVGLGQGRSFCTCTGEASTAAGPRAHRLARRPGCFKNWDLTWQALRAKPELMGGSYKALHSSSA